MSTPKSPDTNIARLLLLLTPAEFRVLTLLSQGMPSREIADRLATTIHTVRRHREHLVAKLGLKGRGQDALLFYALTLGSTLLPYVDDLIDPKKGRNA